MGVFIMSNDDNESTEDFFSHLSRMQQDFAAYSKKMSTPEQKAIQPGDHVAQYLSDYGMWVTGKTYTREEFFRSELEATPPDELEELYGGEEGLRRHCDQQFDHMEANDLFWANWRSAMVPEGELGSKYRSSVWKVTPEQAEEMVRGDHDESEVL